MTTKNPIENFDPKPIFNWGLRIFFIGLFWRFIEGGMNLIAGWLVKKVPDCQQYASKVGSVEITIPVLVIIIGSLLMIIPYMGHILGYSVFILNKVRGK